MFGTHDLLLFVISAALLALTPGQDTLYIAGRSLAQGRRAGLLSVAGIISGCAVHTMAVAFGLSALFAASASALTTVKLAGAAYLCYLGLTMLLDRSAGTSEARRPERASAWGIYRSGMVTNVLNPKVALFFMAFLPQFVDPTAPSRAAALLFLGGVFISIGTCWCLVVVYAASAIGGRLRPDNGAGAWVRRATGVLFAGLGVRLALTK